MLFGKKQQDYQYSCDKIYTKYGKITTMVDDLRSCGCFESSFSTPVHGIVVTGENNSGKTSVINYLTGYNFLPFGTRTLRTLEIRFQHTADNVSPSIKIEGESKNFTNMDEAKKYIANLLNDTNDSNIYEPIRLTLTTNSSEDMLIIDCQFEDNNNNSTLESKKRYLSDSSNLILLVLSAKIFMEENISIRDKWFNLIRNYDRNLERTIGVITKTDELPKNFNYNIIKSLLKENNEFLNLKYGFICVKGNFPSHYSASDITRLEREYFCNHKTFQFLSINDNFTFETLGEKISKFFYDSYQFKKDMKYMYNQMKEQLVYFEKELQNFGADYLDFSSQSKDLYLQSLVNLFCETIEKTFSGKAEFEADNLANTDLKKVYVDFLDKYINLRPSEHYKTEEIITHIQRSEGTGLNGFPTGDVIYTLLSPEIDTLREEIKAYYDNIFSIIQKMIKNIIHRLFKRFPKALTHMEDLVLKFVEDEFNKTRKLQNDISEMNFTYFYIDELSNDYQRLIQYNLLKEQNNNPNNNNNNNNNQKNEMPFKKTSEISFFKSAKDQNSYYKSLAEYVKSLDDYIYFQIIRNLREYIPKATGYFFVKSLKSNMRFYLLQYISKNQEFSENLEEDQDMANKREYYSESLKKLRKISKNISYDDQLTKIIKGDNMKNINNILESQGITRNKSTENLDKANNPNTQNNINNKTPIQSNPTTNLFDNQNKLLNQTQNKKSQNIFGNPIPSKPQQTQNTKNQNISGNISQTQTQSKVSNLFGNPTTTQNKPSNNIFGNPTQTQNKPSNNIFGNPTTTQNKPSNNIFGNPTQTQNKPSNNTSGNQNKQNQTQNKSSNLFGNQTNNTNNNNKEGIDVNVKYDFKTGQVTDVRLGDGKIGLSDVKKAYDAVNPYLPDKETMMKIGKGALNMGQKMYNAVEQTNKNYPSSPNKKTNDPLSTLFGLKK